MAYRKSASSHKDIYQEITNRIIEEMEKGELPWQKAWNGKVGAALVASPVNGATGRPYSKENLIYLSCIMDSKGSKDPRFFTFHQAQTMGYSIKRGSHGVAIKQGFYATKDKDGNPLPEDEYHWTSIISTVFHASDMVQRVPVLDKDGKQVVEPVKEEDGTPKIGRDGQPIVRRVFREEPLPPYVPKKQGYTHEETLELAEEMLRLSGAVIKHDQADRAFYRPSTDEIHLPPEAAFKELAGYYATALHELGHWTGHSSRLNRDIQNPFGSPAYAKEELRAEMASTYLSADLGLPLNSISHAAYTQGWLKALKDDKMEFFKAANDAQKIANYLKGIVKERLQQLDEQHTKQDAGKKEKQPAPKEEKAASVPTVEPKDDKIIIPYKYYLNERPADLGSVPKGFIQLDEQDRGGRYGAIYYDHPLTPEEIKQYELNPDLYYQAQQQVHITVYQAAKDAPWRNASLQEAAGKAADFSQYTAVHHETRKADVGVTELLDQMYDKLQGASVPKLGISDIIRVNDRCFYVDDVGFQEVTIHPLKDKQFLLPIASREVESIKQAQKESVGAEKFEAYQKRFQKVFLEGAQATAETCIGNPVKQYSRFIYNSSIERGLSSIRPCDQKAWQEADQTFIRDSCVNALGEPSAIAAAARVVQANSPYAAVSDDRNYGTTLGTDFMKSPEYRAIREENREIAQVVRH